jgi:hypothetical protein
MIVTFAGTLGMVFLTRLTKGQSIALKGVAIKQDADVRKQLPIAEVEITAANGLAARDCKSDSSGFFVLILREGVKLGHPVTLRFRHPQYQPLDLSLLAGDKICIARMIAISHETHTEPTLPDVSVANVLARYSMKTTTTVNVGSAVKTFEVMNTGNMPCNGQDPCSPDRKWKAALESASLDAGTGNEFQNARVSCIAGPCPFTKIELDDFSRGGRIIKVAVRNWSDTTTFLLEAEVVHPMVSDIVRESYPVIFGQALNFTLPASAEGVSIQAEMNGQAIVFPLGPNLLLSWADCNARLNADQTKVYRCELKSGYQFQ